MNEQKRVKYFGAYLRFFHFQRFVWSGVHGIYDRTMTDAELRRCIDDVTEYARVTLSVEGVPLAVDNEAHLWFKTMLIKKVMGPTKETWVR